MATQDYLDFDLRLERVGDGYRAVVVNAPAGEGAHAFELPFTEDKLAIYLLQIGQRRSGVRRADSPGSLAAREFGGRLFDSVFGGEVRERWYGSLTEAAQQNRGLRLRLRLTGAPELADLPWEFLYDSRSREFVLLSAGTPLVHYLELPERIKPLAVQPPLRALVMVAGPTDYDTLDVEREWRQLKHAVTPLEQQGVMVVERLAQATLPALQARLRQGAFHIFHFIGHGGFDTGTPPGEGVLIVQDDHGRGRRVTGRDLAIYLRDEDTLRLVVLNCCEGARTSPDDIFAGVAQTLVRRGIPAVIAMQFEVSDAAAVCFATEFYRALADDWPVDAALAEARKAIYGSGNSVEWGTPVLHLRAPDGRIFQLTKPASVPVAARLAAFLAEAAAALEVGDWSAAIGRYQAVLALEPGHPVATEKLAEAQAGEELETDYAAGVAHLDAGRWESAVAALQSVAQRQPDHRDVARLLAHARTRFRENLIGPPPQDPHGPRDGPRKPDRPVRDPEPARRQSRSWIPWTLAAAAVGVVALVFVVPFLRPKSGGSAEGGQGSGEPPMTYATNPASRVPPPASPSGDWRVIAAGQEHRPSDAELVSWITERRVDGDTMLQRLPDGDWTRLREVPDLARHLTARPAPPRVASAEPPPAKVPTPAEDPGEPAGLRFLPATVGEAVGYWQIDGWEQDSGQPRRTITGKMTFQFTGGLALLLRYDGVRGQGEGRWTYSPATSVLRLEYLNHLGLTVASTLQARVFKDGTIGLDGVNQGTGTHLVLRRSSLQEVAREVEDVFREAMGE